MDLTSFMIDNALRSVSEGMLIESLFGTEAALCELCDQLKRRSIPSVLKSYGIGDLDRLDQWNLPDAVWIAICTRYPHLNFYPLGEIAERAVKKTIAEMPVRDRIPKGNSKNDSGRKQNKLPALDVKNARHSFLTNYLFELCIDQLRRPRTNIKSDYSFWYNFSKSGYFVPLAFEQRLRARLKAQCSRKVSESLKQLPEQPDKENLACSKHVLQDNLSMALGIHKPYVNIVVGKQDMQKVAAVYSLDKSAKNIVLHERDANVAFNCSCLERVLEHRLHPLVQDLVDIGIALFMTDLYSRREKHLGRRMGLLIPVHNQSVWENTQGKLERAVSFLGRDDFHIHFTQTDHIEEAQVVGVSAKRKDNRCIVLFSGGLDSLAGVAWAIKNGKSPILVSHYAGKRLCSIQKSLTTRLGEIYSRQIEHVCVYATRMTGRRVQNKLPAPYKSLMTQFLRTFMFLSLASAIAIESGIDTIYVFENGPIALNPMFSEARLNTRTTHPHFIASFRALIRAVFGTDLQIKNPFLYHTKGEVVDILGTDPRLSELIAKTTSCWNWFRAPLMASQRGIEDFSGSHDGTCIPCIVRQSAVHHAGLGKYDGPYVVDIFGEFNDLDRNSVTALADYLRFCKNIISRADQEILCYAPDFSVFSEEINVRKLIAMYRRHSEEVVTCFQERLDPRFHEMFVHALN